MLTVKDCITFQWKTISLPIHREEELDFALHHVSYYDSPFSSSQEERRAYYGEDWHKFTGETLETLCSLPDAFTPEQKTSLLKEYRSMIEYGDSTLDTIALHAPISIVHRFLGTSSEEAESFLKLYGYSRELLAIHTCNERQRKLIYYSYQRRVKENESKEIQDFLRSMEDKYGEAFHLAVQQYKVEECLHLLRTKIDVLPALKDRL